MMRLLLMRPFFLAGFLTILIGAMAPAFAQSPKRGKGPIAPNVPGYKAHTIEGFTLLIHDDVLQADTAQFERKPLDVLELELKMITKLMNPKSVNILRRLLIWVKWKEEEDIASGRPGTPVAVYYGGHQLSMLRDGKHPLKGKTITILRMDLLTREHQPKTDAGRCVLLHEMAHAVHDQLLGRTNPIIVNTFRQAMERKLYDKSLYVSTNEAEFFAELTCAYFDQLHYFPRNRRELKEHDPQTFKLMESVWGRSAVTPSRTLDKTSRLANNGSDKYDLKIQRKDIRFGPVVQGVPLADVEKESPILVIASAGGRDSQVLEKLLDLDDELRSFGVYSVIVANPGYGADLDKIRSRIGRQFTHIALVEELGVPQEDRLIIPRPPDTIVFDEDGTCLFRGSGYDALPHVRAAVGRKLVAALGEEEPPQALRPALAALTSGELFLTAIPKLAGPATSSDTAAATAAKKLYTAILAPAEQRLTKIREMTKSDPLTAWIAAEALATDFKGTSVGTQAGRLAMGLRSNRDVQRELAARKMLEHVRKLDGILSTQRGGFDPTDSGFQTRNLPTLRQLGQLLAEMKKKYPTAPATQEAARIATEYGIE
ncbi:MAG: hypothetical protein LC104_19360 [Bacteroidales bacterium]|nr:hypothetical protein [Bacteroidales bacterium]